MSLGLQEYDGASGLFKDFNDKIPLGVRIDELREKEMEGWGERETRVGREKKLKEFGPVSEHTAA